MIDSALVMIAGKIRSPDDAIETIIATEDNKNQLEVDLYVPCVSNVQYDLQFVANMDYIKFHFSLLFSDDISFYGCKSKT